MDEKIQGCLSGQTDPPAQLFIPYQTAEWRHPFQPAFSTVPALWGKKLNFPSSSEASFYACWINGDWPFISFPVLCLLLQLAVWLGTERTAVVFPLWQMLQVCPQQKYLHNQPTSSVLPSVTQRIWRHLVTAFSSSLKPLWSSEAPNLHPWVFLPAPYVFASKAPNCLVHMPSGCWVFCGLISRLVFSITLCLVFTVAHISLWSRKEVPGRRCQQLHADRTHSGCCFALSLLPAAISPRLQVNNEAQRTNKPALLSDVAGPVGYSLEMKGLVPRFGPQYLWKVTAKIFSLSGSSIFSCVRLEGE